MTGDEAEAILRQATEPQQAGKITCEGYAQIFQARQLMKEAFIKARELDKQRAAQKAPPEPDDGTP